MTTSILPACPACGLPKKDWLSHRRGKFCSSKCVRKSDYKAPLRKINCLSCGKALETTHARKKFCSRKCSNTHHGFVSAYPGISCGTVGAINELKVCADLLAKGFDVFRAVSPHAKFDLAILTPEKQLLRIEVRTGYETTAGKVVSAGGPIRADVLAIVTPNKIIYRPEF